MHLKLQIIPALYFKMLSLVLSELVLICNFFEEAYFCYLHAYLPACFYEIHLLFSFRWLRQTIPIFNSRDGRWGRYVIQKQSSRKKSLKICVMFYSALSDYLYRDCGEEKAFFLQSFNLLECIVVGLLTVEGLCSLLFKWERY